MRHEKSSISDKLRSLGVKVGTSELPAPPPAGRSGIDSVLPGTYRQTALGEVFVVEQAFLADHHHGETPLLSSFPLSLISQWANDPRLTALPLEQFAFLDTETSGLSGGTGTYAFLVGAARFINGNFTLQQFFMRDPAEEPALLEGSGSFIAPCASLVTFNGKDLRRALACHALFNAPHSCPIQELFTS